MPPQTPAPGRMSCAKCLADTFRWAAGSFWAAEAASSKCLGNAKCPADISARLGKSSSVTRWAEQRATSSQFEALVEEPQFCFHESPPPHPPPQTCCQQQLRTLDSNNPSNSLTPRQYACTTGCSCWRPARGRRSGSFAWPLSFELLMC